MAQPASAGRWRPHLEEWAAYLSLSKSHWLVINELCRRQGGSRAVVRAGALSLAAATGLHERTVYYVLRHLIDLGLLEPEWLGGGSKNPGGAGLATEYRLGQRARQQPGSPHLQVLKKGGQTATLVAEDKGGQTATLGGTQKGGQTATPDERKYDSLRSSSSADVKDGGEPPDYEPDWAGSSPAIDGYITNRRAHIKATSDRDSGVTIANLLETPLTRPENGTDASDQDVSLDLPPPKRRR
jgi:hypothetical protein